ncbi:hypothetical protein B6S12_03965 [Helicobacter valdiviensis]|uniref:Uncharacterized protein n=1 Tax=Helicobacter valdiviensis TaxID=1458358 RepID=A0A2W6PP48_9HELI|nr:hypothetical protein [Helicobacter valdiviensis]PZT48493.1 hypothetical protein B6S12_03965 [Helicobacter valdiviensis]
MRELNYPYNPNKATYKNAFGQILGELELKKGLNKLPLTQDGEYYEDSFKNVFFVYKGEGILDFSDAKKAYDFSTLPFLVLDYALLNKENLEDRLIKEFLEVYEININKGFVYLAPTNFLELDLKLTQGEE